MKKQNKRNQFTHITLALLIILSILGNALILPAAAQEALTPTDEAALLETPLDGTNDMAGVPTLPEPIELTAADIPEFISAAALEERGAVERMRSEETNMSSVIFRNADGTRTMYMYGLPVKYTAADGTVRDKSTNLVSVSTAAALLTDRPVAETMAQMSSTQQTALLAELGILDAERAADTLHMLSTALTAQGKSMSDMAYTTLDNDVYAIFPTNLTQGMTLVFGEHSVRMTPATGMTMTTGGNVTKTTTASLADSVVTERLLYPNVFGPGTAVQYTPTLTGVKEEILLSHDVGKNSFDFLLETDGLILTETNGQVVLIDPETEQQVGTLGEIIVFDSAGQIVRGNMTAQTVKEGQIYGVTISVDQEFLAGATYPVSIDPTFIIQAYLGFAPDIEDVGVYNTTAAWTYSFEDLHYIGKSVHGEYYGAVLYRVPALYNNSLTNLFTNSIQIGLAELRIYGTMGDCASMIVKSKEFTQNWDNSVRICDENVYNSFADDNNASLYSRSHEVSGLSTQPYFSIDLTNIFRAWVDYTNDPNSSSQLDPNFGLALYTKNVTDRIYIKPVEIGTPADLAYIYITYWDNSSFNPYYYINNKHTCDFISYTNRYEADLCQGTISLLGDDIAWEISTHGNNRFAFSPKKYAGYMYINNLGALTITPDAPGNDCLWNLEYQGNDVIIRNMADSNKVLCVSGNGTLTTKNFDSDLTQDDREACLWRIVPADSYREFELSDNLVEIYANYSLDINDYINTEQYDLCSPGDMVFGILYESEIDVSESGLVQGTTMNISSVITITHRPTGQSGMINILLRPICPGTYVVQNKLSSLFVGVEDNMMVEGTNILQANFCGSSFQKWNFAITEDGYYTIAVEGNGSFGYYLSVANNQSTSGAILTLKRWLSSDSIEEGAKWKIYPTVSGAYKLVSKCGEEYNRVMGVASANSTYVRQYTYIRDVNFSDEWYIMKYAIHINAWYDNAWLEQNPNAVEEIENYLQIAQNVYKDAFEVWISYGVPTNFISVSDQCRAAADQPCTCTVVCDYHHKNIDRIFDTLPTSSASTAPITATVAFIGHYVCENGANGCENARLFGRTHKSASKILVLPHNNEQDIAGTTVHEIGHLLRAPDHYSLIGENTTAAKNQEYGCVGFFSDDCLYGYFQVEYIFCDGCMYEMKQYIFEHTR